MRVDPEAGFVETDVRVPALDLFERIWLTTIEDGRVVVVASRLATYAIALLSSDRFAARPHVHLDGARIYPGTIVIGPTVRYGRISLALRRRVGHNQFVIDSIAITADEVTDREHRCHELDPWFH